MLALGSREGALMITVVLLIDNLMDDEGVESFTDALQHEMQRTGAEGVTLDDVRATRTSVFEFEFSGPEAALDTFVGRLVIQHPGLVFQSLDEGDAGTRRPSVAAPTRIGGL